MAERSTHFYLLANGKSNPVFQVGKNRFTKVFFFFNYKRKAAYPRTSMQTGQRNSLPPILLVRNRMFYNLYVILVFKEF